MACFWAYSSVHDNESSLYYLQSRYYDPTLGRFINADAFASTGQGLLGYNMFAYCRNNPVSRTDFSGYEDEDCTEEKQNKENMMAFFGVKSEDDLPTLADNCMVFVENVKSVSFGTTTVVYGKTVVMDYDKYCVYSFVGLSRSVSATALPIDGSITKGYVYNVESPEDYAGLFLGFSASSMFDVAGFAVAPNGVYAEIIEGESINASVGGSLTYYSTSFNEWNYGKASVRIIPSYRGRYYNNTPMSM